MGSVPKADPTKGEREPTDVLGLLQEVAELPNEERSLMSANERALIRFCRRLGEALRLAHEEDTWNAGNKETGN